MFFFLIVSRNRVLLTGIKKSGLAAIAGTAILIVHCQPSG